MKNIFLLILLLTGSMTLRAQEQLSASTAQDCTKKLNYAEQLYSNGFFNDCIRILEEAVLNCDFSKSEKEKALELLGKSYLETEEPAKADAAINAMLKNSPHYELNNAANFESFNRLVNKYEIHPKFSIGVRNVANWLTQKTMKVHSVLDGIDYSKPIERGGYWFMYYGIAEYQFDKSFSLNLEGGFFWSSYSRSFEKDPGFSLYYFERDQFVETFLYLKKYFSLGKNILPYVSAGAGSLMLYKAIANASISYTSEDAITGKNTDFSSSLSDMSVMDLRNTNVWCWNAGAGVGYKLKNLRIFIDARYHGGLKSMNNPARQNETLVNDFFYTDNELTINQFELGASMYYTLFNSVRRIRR